MQQIQSEINPRITMANVQQKVKAALPQSSSQKLRYKMCVVTNAKIGAANITLVASSLTLKVLSNERINKYPSSATAEEQSNFSVKSISLQNKHVELDTADYSSTSKFHNILKGSEKHHTQYGRWSSRTMHSLIKLHRYAISQYIHSKFSSSGV